MNFIWAIQKMKEGKKVWPDGFGHEGAYLDMDKFGEIYEHNLGYRKFEWHTGMITSKKWRIVE